MENLNSINNFNIVQTISQQKAGMVQSPTDNSQQTQFFQQPGDIQQTLNPSLIFDTASMKMDNEVILKYLQNLLNLPSSIDKFINSNSANSKLLSVFIENMINTKALSEFLTQNSNIAIDKLLQTIANSLKNGVEDISQLKEILGILSSIQSSASTSSNSLRELILLYIPLENQVFDKNIDFEATQEEKEAVKNSKLSIMLETLNFSNILCAINEDKNNLYIDFFCSETFAKEKLVSFAGIFSKEVNIKPYFEFKKTKENENQNSMQNFKIISDGIISTNTLIFSHFIIKTIFKIDADFSTST